MRERPIIMQARATLRRCLARDAAQLRLIVATESVTGSESTQESALHTERIRSCFRSDPRHTVAGQAPRGARRGATTSVDVQENYAWPRLRLLAAAAHVAESVRSTFSRSITLLVAACGIEGRFGIRALCTQNSDERITRETSTVSCAQTVIGDASAMVAYVLT